MNEEEYKVKCSSCDKTFRTERGLKQHCRITNCQTNLDTQPAEPKPPDEPQINIQVNAVDTVLYKCGEYSNIQFEEKRNIRL